METGADAHLASGLTGAPHKFGEGLSQAGDDMTR